MSIDWFTTVAQIINFLILLWLLKKLLFKPIVKAMETREQGIIQQLQQLQVQNEEAEHLKLYYQQQLQLLQQDKNFVLQQAQEQIEEEKLHKLQQWNEEMRQKKAQFADDMLKEQQTLAEEINKTIAEKVLKLSKKVLLQLADKSLEEQVFQQFLKQIEALSESELASLKYALEANDGAIVYSSFELESEIRKNLQARIETIHLGTELQFMKRESLICGIVLEANGLSWGWSMDHYFNDLNSQLLMKVNLSA